MSLHPVIENYLASIPAAEFENKFTEMFMVIKILLTLEPETFKHLLFLKTLEENSLPQFGRLMQELKESDDSKIRKIAIGYERLNEQISELYNDILGGRRDESS